MNEQSKAKLEDAGVCMEATIR